MLPLDIAGEIHINEDNSIEHGPTIHLDLEHSLISISKWEAKYHKPFLSDDKKTPDEMSDYIKFMTVTKVKDETVYDRFTSDDIRKIYDYIKDVKSATKVKPAPGTKRSSGGSFITSEVVYYWLVELGIPFDVEKWHFSRLIKLVEVVSEKRKPKKKMPKSEVLRRHSAHNKAHRAKS